MFDKLDFQVLNNDFGVGKINYDDDDDAINKNEYRRRMAIISDFICLLFVKIDLLLTWSNRLEQQ